MRNYFENKNGHIVPFDKVSCVLATGDIIEVYDSIASDSFKSVDRSQLEDYKKWLHWKSIELELSCKSLMANINLIENHLASSRSGNPNNLTKEQIKAIVIMGWEAKCDNCCVDVEADCRCPIDFEPTDEFVETYNRHLSKCMLSEPVGKSE